MLITKYGYGRSVVGRRFEKARGGAAHQIDPNQQLDDGFGSGRIISTEDAR
jgi:hypothetical protein